MADREHRLSGKPRAEARVVEDLVHDFLDGRIRVPAFQRSLKWRDTDVLRLLDSVYRGFPIGSLLFWQRQAEAEKIRVGPFSLDVEGRPDAWYVVDGQQRLTALAATLHHPDRPTIETAADQYAAFFDLVNEEFRTAHRAEDVDTTAWIPVHRLFDAVDLADWLAARPDIGADLARRAHAVGKVLREYRVPVYIIETDDESVLREVFERTNNYGVALSQAEVFDALIGSKSASGGHRLTDLMADLAQLRMGPVSEGQALQFVLAVGAIDVTRSLKDLDRSERRSLEGLTPAATDAARRACQFIRDSAAVPHLRLLPYAWPLVILCRFFHIFPYATLRSRELLSRWMWRGLLHGAGALDSRTILRRATGVIREGEAEESVVQELLTLVAREWEDIRVPWPDRFDARTAPSRIAMAALAAQRPRDLETGLGVDVPGLINELDDRAFARVNNGGAGAGTVGNRLLHERLDGGLFAAIATRAAAAPDDVALRSHAIDDEGTRLAARGAREEFVAARNRSVQATVVAFAERMTRFGYGDRPSVDFILGSAPSPAE
jgi:hypothetical protein